VAKPVIEQGVSGHKSWRERELGEVVERCKRGEAEGVIVAYFSRLTRERMSSTWEVLEELEPLRLVAVREGIDSPPGESADWNQAIQGFQANTEWKVSKKHLSSGKHAVWERGGYVTWLTPAGYERTTIVEKGKEKAGPLRKSEHAPAIASAFTVRINGGSWSEVARVLSEAEVPTRTGDTIWSTSGAQRLVQNPIYRGTLRCTCGCNETKQIAELAIVTPSMWERANPPRIDNERAKRGRKDSGGRLLSGLLRCAECGYGMTYHAQRAANGKIYNRYRCRSGLRCTSHPFIRAEAVEELIKEEALSMFAMTDPHIGHDAEVETLARLENERSEARARLEALVRIIDPLDPGAEERLAEAREAVSLAEAMLLAEQQAQVTYLSEEQVRQMFAEAPMDQQRQLLRMMIYGASVRAGKEPVGDRVEIHAKPLRWTPRAA